MKKIPTIGEIAKNNPKIHADKMLRLEKLMEKLDDLGIKADAYEIRPPFSPRRMKKSEDKKPTTVRYKR